MCGEPEVPLVDLGYGGWFLNLPSCRGAISIGAKIPGKLSPQLPTFIELKARHMFIA